MGIKFEFFEAGHGDSILVITDEINILIDGGDKGTSEEIEDFLDEKDIDKIDLAILTHIDKDHIKGLLELLDEDVQKISKDKNHTPLIQEIWFNSFKNTPNKEDEIFTAPILTNNTSINHHLTFTKLMNFLNGTIKYKDYISIDYKKKFQIGDIEIILLSPNQKKLDKLYTQHKNKIDSLKNLSTNSYSRDSDNSIDNLYAIPFSNSTDSSVANGSSIAFILVHKERKYLFLADAHIGLIIEELEKYKKDFNNNQKIKFEFIKLSHHGSRNNIHKKFLELVDTDNYVILTDSKGRNRHPDKETLSKIIVHHYNNNPLSKINFIFNHSAGAKYSRYDFNEEDLNKYGKSFNLVHTTSYPWSL
jgi:beta-lactamase superfamily II metal-dependent hydrolase